MATKLVKLPKLEDPILVERKKLMFDFFTEMLKQAESGELKKIACYYESEKEGDMLFAAGTDRRDIALAALQLQNLAINQP